MIERMEHRGGWSCDNDTGDGAGVLTGIPHEFYSAALQEYAKRIANFCIMFIYNLTSKLLL